GQLNDVTRPLFAGIFFQSAERVAARVSRREGVAIWQRALELGLIDATQFAQGRRYLFLSRFNRVSRIYRNYLRMTWPSPFFVTRSATYLRPPAPGHAEAA